MGVEGKGCCLGLPELLAPQGHLPVEPPPEYPPLPQDFSYPKLHRGTHLSSKLPPT